MPNQLLLEQMLEYFRQGKSVIIRVRGRSMCPFLREGDRVLLKPFEIRELASGMIVLAKVDGLMVLHRVIRYSTEAVWLAGDGNLVQHECAKYADVIATAVSLYRGRAEVRLNRRWWRIVGQAWYLARPYRRIVNKLIG